MGWRDGPEVDQSADPTITAKYVINSKQSAPPRWATTPVPGFLKRLRRLTDERAIHPNSIYKMNCRALVFVDIWIQLS